MRQFIFAASVSWGLCLGASFSAHVSAAEVVRSDTDPAKSGQRAQVYAQCSGCHGGALEGGAFGPALKGGRFVAKWSGRLNELRTLISSTMPLSNPGGLSDAEYKAVFEYIVAANGKLGGAAAAPSIHGNEITADEISGLGIGPQRSAPQVFRDATYQRVIAAKQKKLAALTDVSAAMLRSPPDGDWLSWRRTQDGHGYSPLAQINRRNAGDLTVKWSWALPVSTNQAAPIVHDGILFVQSAREVQALDARNGELLWRFRREVPAQFRGPINSTQRNFAIFGDKLFVSTADRHVVALDIRTGEQRWDHVIAGDDMPGVLTSSGPFMAGEVLVQGVAMGPGCLKGCFVVGIDPQTGRRLWVFNTVARPGEPGGDSWNNLPLEARSGAAVWIAGTYDPELDLVYFGTGGTYGISPLLTPDASGKIGDNRALHTNSSIALRPGTGELVWSYQHFPTEIWDLDEVFERTLVDLPVNGRQRRLAVTIGKVGILDALDRETGEYLFSKDFGLTNLVTAINPETGARTINPDLVLKPGRPVDVCPSADGARNWMATAYNPHTRILYIPMQDTCMNIGWIEHDEGTLAKGRLDIGWTLKPPPNTDGNHGRVEAVDMDTRKTLWLRRDRHIPSSSMLATGGGLVFSGNADRWFRALDDRSGQALWEIRLNAVPNSTPITFTAEGKQYVAVVAGGGGAHDAETVEMTPEHERSSPSTTIWVFAVD